VTLLHRFRAVQWDAVPTKTNRSQHHDEDRSLKCLRQLKKRFFDGLFDDFRRSVESGAYASGELAPGDKARFTRQANIPFRRKLKKMEAIADDQRGDAKVRAVAQSMAAKYRRIIKQPTFPGDTGTPHPSPEKPPCQAALDKRRVNCPLCLATPLGGHFNPRLAVASSTPLIIRETGKAGGGGPVGAVHERPSTGRTRMGGKRRRHA
jgi:hypothetical protein